MSGQAGGAPVDRAATVPDFQEPTNHRHGRCCERKVCSVSSGMKQGDQTPYQAVSKDIFEEGTFSRDAKDGIKVEVGGTVC